MRRSLAFIAFLALAFPALGAAQTAPSASLSIWVKSSIDPSKPLQARIARSWDNIRSVFGNRLDVEQTDAEDGNPYVIFSIHPDALASAARPALQNLFGALRSQWGNSVRIIVDGDRVDLDSRQMRAQAASAIVKNSPTLFNFSSREIARLAPTALTMPQGGAIFDGERRNSALEEPSVSGQSSIPRRRSELSRPPIPNVLNRSISVPNPVSEPQYPYAEMVAAAARNNGVNPDVLAALVAAKSNFNADVSAAGFYGLTGLSPRTFEALGYSRSQILDPQANLNAGAALLSALLRQFHGNIFRALAAYQTGPATVLKSGGIPNNKSVKNLLAAFELDYRRTPSGAEQPALRPKTMPEAIIEETENAADAITLEQLGCGRVSRYHRLIVWAAQTENVNTKLMEAMVCQENPQADPSAVSPAGAIGLGQLMPGTAADLHVNPRSPSGNLIGMAKQIKFLESEYAGDPVRTVAAYNAGDGAVKTAGKIPRFSETIKYVKKVFRNYAALSGEIVDFSSYIPDRISHPRTRRTARRIRRRRGS